MNFIVKGLYVYRSCGTPLSTRITQCHNSHKHSQSPSTLTFSVHCYQPYFISKSACNNNKIVHNTKMPTFTIIYRPDVHHWAIICQVVGASSNTIL